MNILYGLAGGAAVGVTAVVCAPVFFTAVGFTAGGVAAGSIAAGIQSSIGVVTAGSAFAAAQSMGVVGVAATSKLVIAGTTAAIGGVVNGYFGK